MSKTRAHPATRRAARATAEAALTNGHAGGRDGERRLSLEETSVRAGVSPATLRRWAKAGLIPNYEGDGSWSPRAVSRARLVARLRERGHSLQEIREATQEGRLAFGYIEELFSTEDDRAYTRKQAAKETGLEPALIERILAALG